jgi:glycosyltransferase involved in cell wall biosynthesis
MPKVTAIVHAYNDGLRIGRALDSLRACDEVLVVDHDSTDDTARIARQHGARVMRGLPGVAAGAYLTDARHDWVLCLRPDEAIGEVLEGALHEWKSQADAAPQSAAFAFNLAIRAENGSGWRDLAPETRLADRTRMGWTGECPPRVPGAPTLAGEVLRFEEPRGARAPGSGL